MQSSVIRHPLSVGTLLESAAFLFEIPTFAGVLAAQVVWGIGATFTSGATEAWLADEVGDARVGHALLRGSQAGQIGGLLGIGASALLGNYNIRLPIVLGGAVTLAVAVRAVDAAARGRKRACARRSDRSVGAIARIEE